MDKVIFMARGGSLVFYGSVAEYKKYCEVTTTIEVYSNISGDNAPYWIQKFAGSLILNNPLSAAQHTRKKNKTDAVSQFYWMFRRYLQIKQNNSKNTLF